MTRAKAEFEALIEKNKLDQLLKYGFCFLSDEPNSNSDKSFAVFGLARSFLYPQESFEAKFGNLKIPLKTFQEFPGPKEAFLCRIDLSSKEVEVLKRSFLKYEESSDSDLYFFSAGFPSELNPSCVHIDCLQQLESLVSSLKDELEF